MTMNNHDCYPVAAMRHYKDAEILYEAGRTDNAMCHYAFSAECFIKYLYNKLCNVIGSWRQHDMNTEFESLVDYYLWIRIHDVRTEIMLGDTKLPEQLFANHPKRRYWADCVYDRNTMEQVHNLVGKMMDELVAQLLDGRISLDDNI